MIPSLGYFCPVFRWYLKTRPFNKWTGLEHLNIRLVRFSVLHAKLIKGTNMIKLYGILFVVLRVA
jgi:hypothetical protein